MANNLKGYDAFQVLRSVFDVDKNCLRVCLVDGGAGGGPAVEVIIDHTTDSIRLGDGTSLITATVSGVKVGLDVNVLNAPTVNTPIITNIIVGAPNVEQSHAFNASTKRFTFKTRNNAQTNYSFASGTSGTNYITLKKNAVYEETDIINTGSLTIYFRLNNADIVEILEWT